MKQRKMLVLFFGLVSLVFSLNTINSTYAKYVTSTKGDTKINVARWDIIVNEEHIKDENPLSTSITPNYIANPNVAEGVIAPGSVGYFDMEIDGTSTDVSFDFDISVTPKANSAVSDIKILKYYIDDVNNITDELIDNKINDKILISDENRVKTVRIYIIWDDTTGIMDNDADTVAGHNADTSNAEVEINLTFHQLLQ